jgi:glycosyltransferase involved in cell wall biosynthesis
MGFEPPTAIVHALRPVEPKSSSRQDIRSAAMIGNFPPRRCGIATFTRDTYASLRNEIPRTRWRLAVMEDASDTHEYPEEVTDVIRHDQPAAYDRLADELNRTGVEVVFLQHEFGIFGGDDGSHILRLIRRLRMPLVTTVHTVLERPSLGQKRVMDDIIRTSTAVIVMTELGADILERVHKAGPTKVHVVPHGAPERPFAATALFKGPLALASNKVIMSFGLLSPNKGLETIIRALPAVVARVPETVYLIVGATHPHLVAREGETYRQSLVDLALSLGVAGKLRFINRFVDDDELVDLLQAADLYVTPYLTEAQITSGTLSYAVALGKPVVSTPFWHARELLAEGVGVLCPFGDHKAFAREICALLEDDVRREAIARRAYRTGEPSRWRKVAKSIVDLAAIGRTEHQRHREHRLRALAQPRLDGLLRMADDCGVAQHSQFGVPDRRHGYCTDDNARALMLLARLSAENRLDATAGKLLVSTAAFLAHAWIPENGRFRNFMSFDRRWLDDGGSDDCCARALEALLVTACRAEPEGIRNWAIALARQVLGHTGEWVSLRAQALIIRAIAQAGGSFISECEARQRIRAPADKLYAAALSGRNDAHQWFEPSLSYDNAHLPGALIRAGDILQEPDMISVGLDMLERLMQVQTAPDGCFAPVATSGFDPGADHAMFDQQPIEALATIDACLAAWQATGDSSHAIVARHVFCWFGGDNVHAISLARPEDGLCHDGLTESGLNENHGAESILSYQLAASTIRELVLRLPAKSA